MEHPSLTPRRGAIASFLFGLWSLGFIFRTSIVGLDGRRYFCLFDDAMISLRYAWNFSHGLGLVWNAGERVEGYTNPLMTLFMSLWTLLFDKSAAALAVQLAGIPILLGIGWLARRLADFATPAGMPDEDRGVFRFLCAAVALAYYPMPYWTLLGMETGLLTLLQCGAVLIVLRHERAGDRRFSPGLVALLGLAYLTRPEAVLFIFIVLLYRLAALKLHAAGWLIIAIECAALGGVIGLHLLLRWLYYGDTAPNTYRLKIGGWPLGDRLVNGFCFLRPFIISMMLPALAAAWGAVRGRGRPGLLFLALFGAAVTFQCWAGGDISLYWRLLAPAVPFFLVLACAGVADFARWLTEHAFWLRAGSARRARLGLTVGIALILLIAADGHFLREMALIDKPASVLENRRHLNIALALNQVVKPSATVAVTWAGVIPYYTGLKAIDILGKMDRHIASLAPDLSGASGWYGMKSVPGHNKYDLNYSVVRLRPTYVQFFAPGRQDFREYARQHYRQIAIGETTLSLLKDSPDVRWETFSQSKTTESTEHTEK